MRVESNDENHSLQYSGLDRAKWGAATWAETNIRQTPFLKSMTEDVPPRPHAQIPVSRAGSTPRARAITAGTRPNRGSSGARQVVAVMGRNSRRRPSSALRYAQGHMLHAGRAKDLCLTQTLTICYTHAHTAPHHRSLLSFRATHDTGSASGSASGIAGHRGARRGSHMRAAGIAGSSGSGAGCSSRGAGIGAGSGPPSPTLKNLPMPQHDWDTCSSRRKMSAMVAMRQTLHTQPVYAIRLVHRPTPIHGIIDGMWGTLEALSRIAEVPQPDYDEPATWHLVQQAPKPTGGAFTPPMSST